MRARRREINIFNMSLLDILCGALGAFCFMMIVALPYYLPPGKSRDVRKSQEETEKIMRDLEKMKERLPDQKSVEELEDMIRRLEAQVKMLQGQVNFLTSEKERLQTRVDQLTAEKDRLAQENEQLRARNETLEQENKKLQAFAAQLNAEKQQLAQENQTLRAKNQSLEEENQKLKAALLARKPFTIVVRTDDFGQGLDLVLFKPAIVEKNPSPIFESWLKGEYDAVHTVRNAMLFGRGVAVNVVEESPPNSQGKLFLRLTNVPDQRKKTEIQGAICGDEMMGAAVRLPKVTLYPERYWMLLGTVTIDPNALPTFKEATEAEREAAWRTLTNAPPPPTPTPTPPPTAEERAAAEAQRVAVEAQRVKRQEAAKKFATLMRLPFDDSGKNDAQILQLTEELLKDLPPRDNLRREVQFRRDHVIEMKARRGEATPTPLPSATVAPRSPMPAPSP